MKCVSGLIIKNKKGNAVVEMIWLIVILLVVGLTGLITYDMWFKIAPDLKVDFSNAESQIVVDDMTNKMPSFLDGAIVFILIGVWIAVLIFAFMVDTHPIFFIISVILLIFAIAGISLMGGFIDDFINDPFIENGTNNLPVTKWIFEHLVILSVVIGFTVLIALYGKGKTF